MAIANVRFSRSSDDLPGLLMAQSGTPWKVA